MTCLISLKNTSVSFGGSAVLNISNLAIEPGEKVLILGPNGSGKSTLLRLIAGILARDSGTISAPPYPIGLTGHDCMLYMHLTVAENIALWGRFIGSNDTEISGSIDGWGLAGVASKQISELSRGQQNRVALARAFLGAPKLLVLDEPSTALDKKQVALLAKAIDELLPDQTLIAASHEIDPDLFSRAIFLKDGRIAADSLAADSSPKKLLDAYQEGSL